MQVSARMSELVAEPTVAEQIVWFAEQAAAALGIAAGMRHSPVLAVWVVQVVWARRWAVRDSSIHPLERCVQAQRLGRAVALPIRCRARGWSANLLRSIR